MRPIDKVHGRLALTAIAIVGSALTGCGTGDGDTTTTVTSTTTVPSGARPNAADSYVGTTSQGLPISFSAAPDRVLALSFGWRARCEDGQIHSNTIRLGGAPIAHGAFVIDGTLETGGVAHVEGKLSGKTASGSLSRSQGSAFGTDCVATGIAWHAKAGSG